MKRTGLAVPTTYDEVMDVCAVLAENEDSIDLPFTMNLHAGWAWEIEFMHFIRSYGGKFLDDETNMPTFNSDAGVAALDEDERGRGRLHGSRRIDLQH